MKCPFCSHENTRVIDSRPAEENNSIRRRRVCDECGKRFTTYEKIETIPLIIIKKDKTTKYLKDVNSVIIILCITVVSLAIGFIILSVELKKKTRVCFQI